MEFLAGDSEVVLLVAFAGWRSTPSAPQAPGQGEQQSELQQGPWPHFPRDLQCYFIVARCHHILSALLLTLEETGCRREREEGGGLQGAVTSSLESTLERGKERLSSAPLA